MFKKKFKVRIKHFAEDKYVVQYAYYYFIPFFKSLNCWFGMSLTTDTECWTLHLNGYKNAELLASDLKSIESVKNWYQKEEEKEKDFYQRKKEYYSKNIPYNTKYF